MLGYYPDFSILATSGYAEVFDLLARQWSEQSFAFPRLCDLNKCRVLLSHRGVEAIHLTQDIIVLYKMSNFATFDLSHLL